MFVFARRGLAGAKRPRRAERAITSGARVLYLKLGTRQTKNYTYHRLKSTHKTYKKYIHMTGYIIEYGK